MQLCVHGVVVLDPLWTIKWVINFISWLFVEPQMKMYRNCEAEKLEKPKINFCSPLENPIHALIYICLLTSCNVLYAHNQTQCNHETKLFYVMPTHFLMSIIR